MYHTLVPLVWITMPLECKFRCIFRGPRLISSSSSTYTETTRFQSLKSLLMSFFGAKIRETYLVENGCCISDPLSFLWRNILFHDDFKQETTATFGKTHTKMELFNNSVTYESSSEKRYDMMAYTQLRR